MEGLIMFIIIGITQVHGNQNKEFFEDDVFVTKETSYYDIPQSCRLFGVYLKEEVLIKNIKLNVSYDGQLWIRAKAVFERKINPIGIKVDCGSNENVEVSLDECSTKCKSKKSSFFHHNSKFCNCTTNERKDTSIKNVEVTQSIIRQHDIDCVIYEIVNRILKPTCDTLTIKRGLWYIGSEICSEKKNYSFMCVKDDKIEDVRDGLLTWKEAYMNCKSRGKDLIRSTKHFWNKYNTNTSTWETSNSKTFWVDFFRRSEFHWGTVAGDDACVAANLSLNGSILLVPISCTEQLPALCHSAKWIETNHKEMLDNSGRWLCCLCLAIVSFIIQSI